MSLCRLTAFNSWSLVARFTLRSFVSVRWRTYRASTPAQDIAWSDYGFPCHELSTAGQRKGEVGYSMTAQAATHNDLKIIGYHPLQTRLSYSMLSCQLIPHTCAGTFPDVWLAFACTVHLAPFAWLCPVLRSRRFRSVSTRFQRLSRNVGEATWLSTRFALTPV